MPGSREDLELRLAEARERIAELEALLGMGAASGIADAAIVVTASGRVSFTDRLGRLFGLERASPTDVATLTETMLSRVIDEDRVRVGRFLGGTVGQSLTEIRLVTGQVLEGFSSRVSGATGTMHGWYFREVTERVRAETERGRVLEKELTLRAHADDANRRSVFLAEASRALASSLDYELTLQRAARLALPVLADYCIVDVLEEGEMRRVAVVHADPEKQPVADRLRARFPLNLETAEGIARVLRSREPDLMSEIDERALRAASQGPEHLRLLRELGTSSAVCAPMIARGRLVGAITLVYGDSGRRFAARDLPLAEDLAHRAAVAIDNARLYASSQEAIRARDEFLSIASHELRTPVTSLLLAAQGVARLAKSDSLDRVPAGFLEKAFEVTMRQSERLAELVDKMLDVSRIQAGRFDLDLQEVDLGATARELADERRRDFERAGSDLRVSTEQVVGRWDRARVQQIVRNLLSNALKYGAGKPVSLRVEERRGWARLVVADEGIGVPTGEHERIFEPFERAVSAQHYAGLGLGLYIVRRVSEALGGFVRLVSSPGEGATFEVELPCAGPPGRGRAATGLFSAAEKQA